MVTRLPTQSINWNSEVELRKFDSLSLSPYYRSVIIYASKFGKRSSGHRTGKGQFSFQSKRKAMPKNCTIALISHASKVMLKILQARLHQYVKCELPDVQTGFRKGRGTRDQIAKILWIMEKAREFQKNTISALLTMPKPLTVWITINCGKF